MLKVGNAYEFKPFGKHDKMHKECKLNAEFQEQL